MEGGLVLAFWNSAFGAAENVDVAFFVRSFEETGDEIPFGGNLCLADRAGSLDPCREVGVAVGTAEDVANSVIVPREQGALDLLSGRKEGPANGAYPRVALLPARSRLGGRSARRRGGEQPVAKDKQGDSDKDENHNGKRGKGHHMHNIMHPFSACYNPEKGLSLICGSTVHRGDAHREPGGHHRPGPRDL